MPIIQVPEALREKLGDKASEGLVTLIKDAQEEQKSHLLELVEERFARRVLESQMILRGETVDLSTSLRGEMADLSTSLRGEMADLSTSLRHEMVDLSASLRKEIADTSTALRKEMHEGFLGIQKQFLRVEEKFTGLQSQITAQTRWLIGLIAFIAVAFKLVDLFVK